MVPPGIRTFNAPSSSRSRLTVAWVATTPSAASSSTNWIWLDTGCSSRSLAMRCWRWGLPRVATSGLQELGQQRPGGVHPVGGLFPHHRRGAVDHRSRDLFPPVRWEAVHEEWIIARRRHQLLVDLVAGERL